MPDNKKLYDFLTTVPSLKGAAPLKDFNTFNQKYSTPELQEKLYSFLNTVPELKGAKPLADINTFKSTYFAAPPKEEKGFFSKAWEKITSSVTSPGFISMPFSPSEATKFISEVKPSEAEKEVTKKQLQTIPAQKPIAPLDPIAQTKKDYDDVVNPFKQFRKYVPDPTNQSDSLNVGNDLFSFGYQPTKIQIQDDQLGIKDEYIKIGKPRIDKDNLSIKAAEFKAQKDEQIKKLNGEKLAKISEVYKKYPDEEGISAAHNQNVEISIINNEYDKKINEVEKAYNNLNENIFQPALTNDQNKTQIQLRTVDSPDLNKRTEQLNNSIIYLKNLNKQEKPFRLRNAAQDVIESEYLGEDREKLNKELDLYYNPELTPDFVNKTKLSRESKEYRGTLQQIAINKNFLDGYIAERDNLLNGLNKNRADFERQLQEQVYSKGLSLSDLTPESRKIVEDNQNKFKEIEALIKLYDENIKLSQERNNILLSDVGDFKELIDYKSEQDKINKLYQESPLATFVYSWPAELFKRVGNVKEVAGLTNIVAQQKLGLMSKEDADFYLKVLPEESQRKVYVQKLVEDEETGDMVYRNLKDVEGVSIYDEKNKEYRPVSEWVQNADALVYQMLNTTAESFVIGGTGLLARKGLYALGRAAVGSLPSELAILETIDASAAGLSKLDKSKLLGMQALKKGGLWAADVSSMVPATTFLYSPEMINTEIEKGLSAEDVAITAGLRLLAENVSENMFFDDVKFVDNLLKSGTIKNYQDLAKSEAYRLLMDKVSMAYVGRKLSEFEYKSLFTGKGLKEILTKENFQFLVSKTLPKKAKYLGQTVAFGTEASLKESGEEVSTNVFNYVIDEWRKSKDPKYKPDQEFTFDNQVNTVVQTMASMLLLGATEGRRSAKQKASERRFNIDLAAYQVSITPNVYKENLYNQFMESQKSQNPMSRQEFDLRSAEIDRIANVYKSLGFSEEKTKENIQKEVEKLKSNIPQGEAKDTYSEVTKQAKTDDVLSNELLKQAEREVRNTEFQLFRDALTKSDLEIKFSLAKTDKEKEELLQRTDKAFETIEQLKQQRTEQLNALRTQKEIIQNQEFSDLRLQLSGVVQNIDSFVESVPNLNDLDKALEVFENFQDSSDETIKDYASVIATALKNRQYEMLSQGETRMTPEEIAEKQKFEANNFNEKEVKMIELLSIKPEEISKVDGKIIYNHEGQPVEFNNFKEILDFKQNKEAEKQEKIRKAEKEREELEQLDNIQRGIGDAGKVFKNSKGRFGIQLPSGESFEFDSIEELEDYILNPEPKEDPEQDNLDLYNKELDNLYEEYKKSKKKPLPNKNKWLKTIAGKKALTFLKQKYGIKDDSLPIEDTLAVTFNPLATELTDNQIIEVNNLANIEALSSNTIQQEGKKLVTAATVISYQARQFEEKTEVDENQVINRIEDSVNELNKEFLFIHSPEFKIGQNFSITILPFETSKFVESEKETLRNNARHLIEQGISQDEINADLADDEMFQEIQIFNADGTKRIGAIHSLSYIRPERVVAYLTDKEGNQTPNLAANYKQLKELRKSLISAVKQGKNVTLTFTDKTGGWLSYRVNFENKVAKEAFKNKEVLDNIQVLSKQSKLRIKGQETINEAPQGATVIPIIMPNGKYFAFTLNRKNLIKPQADTFINAILLHAKYQELYQKPATNEIKETLKNIENVATAIQKDTDFDILTADGLKDYLQLFVNVNSKTSDYYSSAEKETLKNQPFIDVDKDDKTGNFRITFSNARVFEAFDENASTSDNFKNLGIYRLTLPEIITNSQNTANLLKVLEAHLLKRKINHSTELSKGLKAGKKFNLPYIKKSNLATNPFIPVSETELNEQGLTGSYRNYKEFLLDTSVTPLLETDLQDGTYSYFQQPNLAFVPNITEKEAKPEVKESEVTPAPEEKPEAVPTDIEAKKADIERRRKEELISAVTTPISYEEFAKTKPQSVIVNNIDVYQYDKDLKKYVLVGAASSTGTSLESIAAREEGAKDIEFFKDKSLKLDTVNFFWSERTTGRSPITRLTSYKKRTNQGRIDERVGDKLVEINAEYDAELARELYKEIKAGKLVTDMTPAEQQVADKYITEELRKSVDAELTALEGKKEAEPKAKEIVSTQEVAQKQIIEEQIISDETGFDSALKSLDDNISLIEEEPTGDIPLQRGQKDPNLESKYFSEGKETTSTEVLNKIASSSHPLAPLAKKLLEFDPKSTITLVDGESINGKYAGIYYPKTNSIKIAKDSRFRGLGSEVTLLHEIIHAQTYFYIHDNPDSKLVQDLEKSLNKIKEHNKDFPQDDYAFTNLDELIVGVFTDAAAIKFLQSIPASKPEYKNLFVEIYEYIKSLFKFTGTESTMYDQVFAIGTNIITLQKEYTDFIKYVSAAEEDFIPETLEDVSEKVKESKEPKKDIIFTPFTQLEKLPEGKPC